MPYILPLAPRSHAPRGNVAIATLRVAYRLDGGNPVLSGTGKKLIALSALAAFATLVWFERAPIVRWYAIHRLAQAGEDTRAEWVERVAALDAAAKWGLIDLLRRNDVKVCDNAASALSALEKRWGPTDP